jgi:uncharacterized Zn finger protein (UPF0148 family)
MKTLKKSKHKTSDDSSVLVPLLGTYVTAKECPKCDAKLFNYVSYGEPGYFCKKCGYRGGIGLEPLVKNSKKKFEKAVKDMKTFLKSKTISKS